MSFSFAVYNFLNGISVSAGASARSELKRRHRSTDRPIALHALLNMTASPLTQRCQKPERADPVSSANRPFPVRPYRLPEPVGRVPCCPHLYGRPYGILWVNYTRFQGPLSRKYPILYMLLRCTRGTARNACAAQ